MKDILDIIHKTIYQFFDVCGDDEEVPVSDKDKLLLEVNKAICNNLKALEQEPCEDAINRIDTRIIHTDGLEEGIRCAMCTNSMANDRGCDGGCAVNESMYKRVLDVIKKNILEQYSCEDCISRRAVLDLVNSDWKYEGLEMDVVSLPSVQPEPKKGYISIADVMSVFDDFMCGEVDEDGTETFLEMLKDKAESEEE